MDCPSDSRALATHHLDVSDARHVLRESPGDKRTSWFVSCLKLPLTVWAGRVTINTLPEEVLLLIFHFDCIDRVKFVDRVRHLSWNDLRWTSLVCVCRRWRSVVFASPNFLDLRLVCGPTTRVELTGIWPPIPIIIRDLVGLSMPEAYDFEAAIVHPDRVCQIDLSGLTLSDLQRLASAMQEPFSSLIHLRLDLSTRGYGHAVPSLPDGFLGGSSPRLQSLVLNYVAFPALPKLLLSATDLVRVEIWEFPHSISTGCISPEAIVSGLALSVNLKFLAIGFGLIHSCPDMESRRPPPPMRAVLPLLTRFVFQGSSKYLDDFLARIDVPSLDSIIITFFSQPISDIPQLARLMRRTTRFQTLNEGHVTFSKYGVSLESLPPTIPFVEMEMSGLRITFREHKWGHSCLAQVLITLSSLFPSIYIVERLYIYGLLYFPPQWDDIIAWPEILRLLTAVKDLYACRKFAECIVPALQELVGEEVTDVLPTLRNFFVEELESLGPVQEAIRRFVAARQLSGRPVAISPWKKKR